MSSQPEYDRTPVDPPADGGDEYGVAPLPKHWADVPKASDDEAQPETYEVGEEVTEAPYRTDANTWQDVVAGRSSASDDEGYGVGPQAITLERRSRILSLFRHDVQVKLRENEDRRIGRVADPRRFTLARLLFVFTLASIVLAVGARFPRGAFAGACGAAAFAMVLVSRSFLIGSAFAQLAWGTLTAIYILASIFSLLNL
jgi:hypothetical protein